VSWAKDGHRLASAGYGASIWDTSGEPFSSIPSARLNEVPTSYFPSGGLYEVAWSQDPESQWLAGASSDNTVIVWDARSEKLVVTLEGHTGHVRSVAFSGDNQLLASGSNGDGIRLWNCGDWRPLAAIHLPGCHRVVFHPNEPILAATTDSGTIYLLRQRPDIEADLRRGHPTPLNEQGMAGLRPSSLGSLADLLKLIR
jgi:WD40 repeat protein